MTIGGYSFPPETIVVWAAAGAAVFLAALSAYALCEWIARLSLPEHERLILRYRLPADEATAFRARLFADEAHHQQALRRWHATNQRADRITNDIVALSKVLDRRRAEVKVQDESLRAACNALFEQLTQDLASASWIAEEWDEKVRAMERIAQALHGDNSRRREQEGVER